MFKKIAVTVVSFCMLVSLWIVNSKPVFKDFSDKFEVYSSTSSGKILTVTKENFCFVPIKSGESFGGYIEDFDFNSFIKTFDLNILFTESTEEGISYYAYSDKMKNSVFFKGKTVNVQVFFGKNERFKVGTPLIYGSF